MIDRSGLGTAKREGESPLLTTVQAAELLNISQRHLWTITQKRLLRCIRIGRSVRYSPEDIRVFLASSVQREGA